MIYKLYTEEGIGRKKICDILNSKYNYPTPSVYYQMKHLERGRIYKHPVQKLWSTYMIRNILENDVYCGTLRTHKKKTVSIRGKARCKCHEIKESDILIHFKEFLKFTKNKYLDEINKIQIQTKTNTKANNKEKIKFKIETLNAEYKVLISQEIKDLTNATNEYQREMIENTYKELEKDKTSRIEQLQKSVEKQQEDLDKEEIKELKNAIEYFDDILKCNEPNRYILECLIDKILIYHDKSVKFDLKPEISRLI